MKFCCYGNTIFVSNNIYPENPKGTQLIIGSKVQILKKYPLNEELFGNGRNQYYNLRYNPSAPFVRSRFLVSYRIRSAIKTTATRTAPHLKYIQGIGIPNKVSFEILAMNTGLN